MRRCVTLDLLPSPLAEFPARDVRVAALVAKDVVGDDASQQPRLDVSDSSEVIGNFVSLRLFLGFGLLGSAGFMLGGGRGLRSWRSW